MSAFGLGPQELVGIAVILALKLATIGGLVGLVVAGALIVHARTRRHG